LTTSPRPTETGAPRPPPAGAVPAYPQPPRPGAVRPHILVVNGRKVRNPVFVLGAPWSGAAILGRALKRSEGFHITLGQRWVLPVVHAFARNPLLARDRAEAAATVLRDAFAQGWQISPHCCLGCSAQCRAAGGAEGPGPCVGERAVSRYGDASPDLLYCAEPLLDAFPDARLVQIIRDGRDVVAAMLADPEALAWFRPGFVNLDAEPVHPVLGLESQADRAAWPGLSLAGKCALRWRGTVRLMARLRNALSAEQLITLRYEEMIRQPVTAAGIVSAFIGDEVSHLELRPGQDPAGEAGVWRRLLSPAQAADVERVAGPELRRVGYGAPDGGSPR
jgi:Sulfotransferase family